MKSFLNEDKSIQLLPQTFSSAPTSISIKVGDTTFKAISVSDLYKRVLEFLDENGCLEKLELPIATGTKRYLIAKEPRHQRGNDFTQPVDTKVTTWRQTKAVIAQYETWANWSSSVALPFKHSVACDW